MKRFKTGVIKPHVIKSGVIADAAWSYEDPVAGAAAISGHVAFYADKVTIEVL